MSKVDEEKSQQMQLPAILGGINEGSLANVFAKNAQNKSQADTPPPQQFTLGSAKNFMIKSQKQQQFQAFKVINEDSVSEEKYENIKPKYEQNSVQSKAQRLAESKPKPKHPLRSSETSDTRQQEYQTAKILNSESEEQESSSINSDLINQYYEESNTLLMINKAEATLSEKVKSNETNNTSNNLNQVNNSVINNVSQSSNLVLVSPHSDPPQNAFALAKVDQVEKEAKQLRSNNVQTFQSYSSKVQNQDQETQTINTQSYETHRSYNFSQKFSEKVDNPENTQYSNQQDVFSLTRPEISFATVIYQEMIYEPEKVAQLIDNIKEELDKEKFFQDYQSKSEEKKFVSQHSQTETIGFDKAVQLEAATFDLKRNQIVQNLANVFKVNNKDTESFDPTEEIAELERDQDSNQAKTNQYQFLKNKKLDQYTKSKLSVQELHDQNVVEQNNLLDSIQAQNKIVQNEQKDENQEQTAQFPVADVQIKKSQVVTKTLNKAEQRAQNIQKYHQSKGQKVLKGFYMSSKYFNLEDGEAKTNITDQQTKLETQFIDPIHIKNIVCDIKQSYIEHHPHYGQYFEIKSDLDEAPELIKFAALHSKDKIYLKFLPDHNQNNFTCPCIVKDYEFKELKQLQQNTYDIFEAEFCNTSNLLPVQTLFPATNGRIILVRLSSLGSKEPTLFRYLFKQFKFQPRYQQFAGQKYIEMPFTNISFRSISFVKQLVREIINARTAATCAFLLQEVTKSDTTQTMQTRYKQVAGTVSRCEFESIASFTVSFLTQKYGQQSLVLQVLFNLISNLAYYQYEDAELYLFCRFLFDDLENDYQQVFFEMRRIMGLHQYSMDNVELVSASTMGQLIQEIFQGFDTKRQQQFMNQLSQVIYARTVEKVTPKILLFSEMASIFLFQYGVYRRQVWGQFTIVYNYLLEHKIGVQQFALSKSKLLSSNSGSIEIKENLSLAKFSVLCEILVPQWSISTVQELFFAFQTKNVSISNLEELFKSHQLARFVKIDKELIKSATTTENVERTMQLLELFKILNPVADKMKLMFQVKGKQEVSMQISNLIEIIKSDLSIFDTQKAIQNIFAIIEVFCKNMIKKREDVIMAIVTGAVTSMTLFG